MENGTSYNGVIVVADRTRADSLSSISKNLMVCRKTSLVSSDYSQSGTIYL